MDMTLVEHAIIAALVQLALAPFVGLRSAGLAAVMVFLGREIAQNEFEALGMEAFAGRNLATLEWWAGLRHGWSLGSVLDVLSPALACSLVYGLGRLYRHRMKHRRDHAA